MNKTSRIARRCVIALALTAGAIAGMQCGGDDGNGSVDGQRIDFGSVSPDIGPPGTFIAILGVDMPAPAESLVIQFGSLALSSIVRQGGSLFVTCPQVPPGQYVVTLNHPTRVSTELVVFTVTPPIQTGVAPGAVFHEISSSVSALAAGFAGIAEVLESDGLINPSQLDAIANDVETITTIFESANELLTSVSEADKRLLDQHLAASGLRELFTEPIPGQSVKKPAASVRSRLESSGEYAAFNGLVLGDNLSFVLSEITPVFWAVNVGAAIATSGATAAPLSAILLGLETMDNLIEGYIPTDLSSLEMQVTPPEGATLIVGQTGAVTYWGKFESQSDPVTATISSILNGALAFLPSEEIVKVVGQVAGPIGISAIEQLLQSEGTITIDDPVRVDIRYYQSSLSDVLESVSGAFGFLPGDAVLRAMDALGVAMPTLGTTPVTIAWNYVTLSGDYQSLTANQPGTVPVSSIVLKVWTMDAVCKGKWWEFACLGIEWPQELPATSLTVPVLSVSSGEEPSPHITLDIVNMSFAAEHNGPLPSSYMFTLTNESGGTLHWSVTDDAAWLDLSHSSGSGNSVSIEVWVNTTTLSPAIYSGLITVSSDNADNSPQTIEVDYAVSEAGVQWASLGSGFSSGFFDIIRGLTVYDGKLIAAGSFANAGGVPARNIAAWDGNSWEPLGAGLNGSVMAVTVYDGRLIVGGSFDSAGTISANCVAAWDGNSWSALGSGMNFWSDFVSTLTVHDEKLVAGGRFFRAGGVDAAKVAVWNGTTWAPLGSGLDDVPNDLISYDGSLLAAGFFNLHGEGGGVAHWVGPSWTTIRFGAGSDGVVAALGIYRGRLHASGHFWTPEEGSKFQVVTWDGSQWHSVGDWNAGCCADSFIEYDDQLVAGGHFGVESEGDDLNYIALWNGSTWNPLGSGLDGRVLALAVYDGQLIVGGAFTTAGGVSAYNIASWQQ